MKTFGCVVVLVLGSFVLFALTITIASCFAFGGEWPMILCGILSILLWGTFAGLGVRAMLLGSEVWRGNRTKLDACARWSRALCLTFFILAVLSGLPLAFGAFASCGPLWLSGLYHWGGLAASVVGFVAWFLQPTIQSACGLTGVRPIAWWQPLVTGVLVYGGWGAAWGIAYAVLSGSVDESTYPVGPSPYRLPFPGGESAWVIQGNNTGLNHTDDQQHAWDFRRSCGSPVLAARDGVVSNVVDTNSGHGDDNNEIAVTHADGTVARYLHVQQNSAVVTAGTTVTQGDRLASAGNVGNSLTGHIHFVVENGGQSIPVVFDDVAEDSGIPRTFFSYTSGNR